MTTMKEAKNRTLIASLTLICSVLTPLITTASAERADEFTGERLVREREKAKQELSQYFDKQVSVKTGLSDSWGPERDAFGKKLVGCPAEPVIPAEPTWNVDFRTTGAGPWAGGVDAINIPIKTAMGVSWMGYAYPSNSTARLPGQLKNAELEFSSLGITRVKRALVDQAAAEFDRCFSKVAPGNYTSEEIQKLCPYRQVSRSEQKQTCIEEIEGTIGKPLADGSGYEVTVIQGTECDFVGWGQPAPRNTGFTRCYANVYKGVATISSEDMATSAPQQAKIRLMSKVAKKCERTPSGRRSAKDKIGACVVREMAKAMASR